LIAWPVQAIGLLYNLLGKSLASTQLFSYSFFVLIVIRFFFSLEEKYPNQPLLKVQLIITTPTKMPSPVAIPATEVLYFSYHSSPSILSLLCISSKSENGNRGIVKAGSEKAPVSKLIKINGVEVTFEIFEPNTLNTKSILF